MRQEGGRRRQIIFSMVYWNVNPQENTMYKFIKNLTDRVSLK